MAKATLGSGKRFASLTRAIAARGHVRNPAAVAAAIGRKKYGAKRFAQLSAHGRRVAAARRSR
jgi:hypothetical protein